MTEEKLSITFDEENNIRVLQAEKFRETDQLKSQCMEFITKVSQCLWPGNHPRWNNLSNDGFVGPVCREDREGEAASAGRTKQSLDWKWKPKEEDDGAEQPSEREEGGAVALQDLVW